MERATTGQRNLCLLGQAATVMGNHLTWVFHADTHPA
jgi:hypothetical protein